MDLLPLALAGLAVLVLTTLWSRRTGIAAPLILVALGLLFSVLPSVPTIELEPEWILAGVLPPLLYSSSVRLPVVDLRRNFGVICWLSIVVVVAGAVLIGGIVHWLVPAISLPLAIALGAVVAPTDAVAATAIGKRLGLPPRVMTVLEGESLLNDASALVTLRTALAAVSGGFSLLPAVGSFVFSVAVAALIGAVVGALGVRLRAGLADPVLNSAVSFAVPFIAFSPAEHLGASGVVSVVIAGLVTGHRGHARLSAADRSIETMNWSTVTFLLENGVFLLMGMQLMPLIEAVEQDDGLGLGTVLRLSLLVLGLLIAVRALAVGAVLVSVRADPRRVSRGQAEMLEWQARLDSLEKDSDQERLRQRLQGRQADLEFLATQPITVPGGLVLGWSGMRGVVTLAAAQTITAGLPNREAVVLIAFAVAVGSLALFGGTLPWLIRRLAFEEPSAADRSAEFHRLMSQLVDSAAASVGSVREVEVDGQPINDTVVEAVIGRLKPMLRGVSEADAAARATTREQAAVVLRLYLVAMREALVAEQSIGAYSTAALTQAEKLLDRQEHWSG